MNENKTEKKDILNLWRDKEQNISVIEEQKNSTKSRKLVEENVITEKDSKNLHFATLSRASVGNSRRLPTRKIRDHPQHSQSLKTLERVESDHLDLRIDEALKNHEKEKAEQILNEQEEQQRLEKERKRKEAEQKAFQELFNLSILKKTEEATEKILIQVKGTRNVKSIRVELSSKSLNNDDVFLLDTGGKILYLWNGKNSNRVKRAKALDLATRIKNKERGGNAKIITINSGEEDQQFWEEIGGKEEISQPSINSADIIEDFLLYQANLNGGYESVEFKKLQKSMLESDFCYILDCKTEMYVWIGKRSPESMRQVIFETAKELLKTSKRPDWATGIKIRRLVEGGETILFQEKFCDWPNSLLIHVSSGDEMGSWGRNIAKTQKITKYDSTKMLKHHNKRPEIATVDDGSGEVEVFLVNEFGKETVPQQEQGNFYSNRCYLVWYRYNYRTGPKGNYVKHILYFWQGRDSKKNDIGASAFLIKDMVSQMKDSDVSQERVLQNKEPAHFLSIFKGGFIVHKGADTQIEALYRLNYLHSNLVAIQCPRKASSLNSRNSFILKTKGTLFLWQGKLVSDEENVAGVIFVSKIKQDAELEMLQEGLESENFWMHLGGKTVYADVDLLNNRKFIPKLFQCSESTGVYEVEEISSFYQNDLELTNAYILDAFSQIFVWVGIHCSPYVKKMTLETAVDYSKVCQEKEERNQTPVYLVSYSVEPLLFKCQFPSWYDFPSQIKEEASEPILVEEVLKQYQKSFTLEEIMSNPPDYLDKSNLENYLLDEEFEKVFGMSKEIYRKLPIWKQTEKKKQVGLY